MRSGPGAAFGRREAAAMLPALFGRAASATVLLAGERARIATCSVMAYRGCGERNPSRDGEVRTHRSDSNQMPPGGEPQFVSLFQTHRMPLANEPRARPSSFADTNAPRGASQTGQIVADWPAPQKRIRAIVTRRPARGRGPLSCRSIRRGSELGRLHGLHHRL